MAKRKKNFFFPPATLFSMFISHFLSKTNQESPLWKAHCPSSGVLLSWLVKFLSLCRSVGRAVASPGRGVGCWMQSLSCWCCPFSCGWGVVLVCAKSEHKLLFMALHIFALKLAYMRAGVACPKNEWPRAEASAWNVGFYLNFYVDWFCFSKLKCFHKNPWGKMD